MKKLLCILLFWSLVLTPIIGQTTTETQPSKPLHTISMGVGLSRTALKLETVSPLIFSGIGVPFQLTYRREKPFSRQMIQLAFQSQTLKSPFGFKLVEVGGHLSYSYLRRVKSFSTTHVYFGGELGVSGRDRTMPQGMNNASSTLINALKLVSLADFRQGKHRFETQLSLAVLGYNQRPNNNFSGDSYGEFFKDFKSNARLEVPPQYLDVSLGVAYFVPTTAKHFSWRFDYWGNYSGFQQRQYLGVLTHQFMTSITYQF
jgi:hypothetical protein